MEQRTFKKRLAYFIIAVIFVIGMIVGTLYDFEITKALSGATISETGKPSYKVGWFALLMEIVGNWATPVLGAVSICIVEINIRRRLKKPLSVVSAAIATLFSFALMLYGSYETIGLFTDKFYTGHYIIIFIIAATDAALLRFITENIPDKTVRRLFGPALFTLAAGFLRLASVEGLKLIWGRTRFYELSSTSVFEPWYILHPFSGSKSFPSGHTSAATLLLLIPLWINDKRKKRIAAICLSLFIPVMAVSRLCAGAHYLTDVLCGFAISFVIVTIIYALYRKTFPEKSSAPDMRTNTRITIIK